MKTNHGLGQSLSRRNLLKGLGVGALGASAGLYGTARAQQAASTPAVVGLERTTVGDTEVTVIKDLAGELPTDLFVAPEGAVADLLGEYNLPTGGLNVSFNTLLVRRGDDLTLIDTGNGAGGGGSLLSTLEAVGVAPADVNHVVLTHWHGDHVTGVSTGGTLNFPNAAHHLPQLDWDFLQAQAGSDEGARASLASLTPADEAGALTFYDGEAEIVPGLAGVPAYGHTSGHHALLLSSGDASLLVMADTAHHPLVSLAHPEWAFGFDTDPQVGIETRRRLLGRAADEGLRVTAYHFAFPGFGYVVREGEGFRFTPSL